MAATATTHLKTAVASVRTAITAGALTLLVGFGAMSVLGHPQPAPSDEALGLTSRALDRMLEHHRCSTTGFAPEVIPDKAVVTSPSGRTKVVSFDEGWRVFKGEMPGELIAVCLGRERPRADR